MKQNQSPLAAIDLVGAGLILIGAAATYFLGIAPVQRAAAVDLADRATLAIRKSDVDTAELQLSSAKERLTTLRAQVAESSTTLKPASELFTRIQAITLSAQSHALTVSEMKPSPAIPGKRFNRVPIHLSGVGAYPAFSAFIKDLHTSYADLQLVSFRLSGHAEDSKTAPSFEADLSWYTSADPVKAAPANGNGGASGGAGTGQGAGGAGTGLSAPAAPPQ